MQIETVQVIQAIAFLVLFSALMDSVKLGRSFESLDVHYASYLCVGLSLYLYSLDCDGVACVPDKLFGSAALIVIFVSFFSILIKKKTLPSGGLGAVCALAVSVAVGGVLGLGFFQIVVLSFALLLLLMLGALILGRGVRSPDSPSDPGQP